MKVEYHIQERCSGKTTELIRLFNENPSNSYYISKYRDYSIKSFVNPKYHSHILTVNDLNNGIIRRTITRILIDDYNDIENKSKFHNIIFSNILMGAGEVIIKTTHAKPIKKGALMMGKSLRYDEIDISYFKESDQNDIIELKNSLITLKNTQLFDNGMLQ